MGLVARMQLSPTTISSKKLMWPDPVLMAAAGLIVAIGIVVVTSAGYIIAASRFSDGFYYTKKQGLAIMFGLGVMYLVSLVNPSVWKKAAPGLLVAGLALLMLVLLPGFGLELGGSRRWINLPFGFFLQPSEFVKHALVIFLAVSLAKKGDTVRDFLTGFLPNMLVMGVVVFLVLAQPDFGTALIITAVGFLMLFISGVRPGHLLGSAILCVPFLAYFAISAPYRLVRLKSFLNPWSDPLDAGFQVIQSLVAFGCGEVWGVGLGKGIQKLYYLPQPHTDFIFAVAGEELGFVGIVVLICLFYVLILRGFLISLNCKDNFQKYLAFGITSLIGMQAMVHMAVSMGLLPTKGLPLPLVSLGGTSMVMNLAGLGILMAIAKNRNAQSTETEP